MSTKCNVTADGIVHDAKDTEVLTGRWTFSRCLDRFRNLSDQGQFLVWLAIGLPITAAVIYFAAIRILH